MTEMVSGKINDRWELTLPDFREEFHRVRPDWERGRLEHMAEHVTPGMTVFDVGAELGDFTSLYRSWVGDDGIVVPFEPKWEMWASIQGTWSANFAHPPAACYVGFVSNITKPVAGSNQVKIHRDTWPAEASAPMVNDPGFHHLAQEADHHPQIRLDEFAEMTGIVPDVIVTDIEGAEWHAVKGCERLIENGVRPIFYISVHRPTMASWYGTSKTDLDQLFWWWDYEDGVQLPAHGEGEEFWLWTP